MENIHIPFQKIPLLLEDSDNILDLSYCSVPHEAFLNICEHIDASPVWSLKCPDKIRTVLRQELPHMGVSPYTLYLQSIF